MGEDQMCLECLQQRIQTDFSDKLIFRYGISDSALPFASRAVVQIGLSSGGDKVVCEEISPQLVLAVVANHEDECQSEYVDGYPSENVKDNNTYGKNNTPSSDIGQCPAEASFGVLNDEIVSLAFTEDDPQCSVNFSSTTPAVVESEISSTSYSHIYSCSRAIAALSPVAYVGIGSYSTIEDLVHKYLSGCLEDHIMSSLNLLIEGKQTDQDVANFLGLVGLPSFTEGSIAGCVRHPNIAPVLGMLKVPGYISLLYPKPPYTLENILHYSPKALKSDWHIRFLIYQILSALAYIHGLGVTHGNLCPSNIMLTDSCWSWLSMSDKRRVKGNLRSMNKQVPSISPPRVTCCMENCPSQSLYADLQLSPSTDWHCDFKRWWKGELSNYDYLLVLNRLAGRRWGDHTFHIVMPWVIDFSVIPDETSDAGWRDLRKSKWRLAKGDEQLDFTYSTSEIPHHVSDECLSELAVCSYKARRLPLSVLRSAVRSVYEPNEYPANMQRLYQWTPDECIPEFYSDPRIFISLHSGMSDLAVPAWASSPEEFISLHRAALESDRVSRQIHHWFDITFGYKMSGEAAVIAKNVMLPTAVPMMPKSMGRRQLFTRPHPMRRGFEPNSNYISTEPAPLSCQLQGNQSKINSKLVSKDFSDPIQVASEKFFTEANDLGKLEEAISFCEYGRNLSPCYTFHQDNFGENTSREKELTNEHFKNKMPSVPRGDSLEVSDIDLSSLLEYLEADDSVSMGFQELLLWRQKPSLGSCSQDAAGDIFSVGCMLAEMYLNRPLYNPVSFAAYWENSILPGLIEELPPHAKLLVEVSIQRDWERRPSAQCLLESPYFPATVRSAYFFLAPLHLLARSGSRLQYAAKFAKGGALKSMGAFAAEMCAPYCLPLIMASLSDVEAESALYLLIEFLKCLKPQAIKTLILPAMQKILQATDYSHLKVLLLQNSFVREVWKQVGKHAYLEKMHPLVISNLYVSPHKNSASAASVLLIGSCEELGIPVTVNQTILPLIHCFGKGICTDGIDALVRIGGLLGENFVVRQLLPLLRNVIVSCIDVSCIDKPEPLQSWNSLALIDSLVALDGLAAVLPREVVLKELIQDQICLHVKVLTQVHLELPVLQVAATTLIAVCQRIGPDFSALHVLPQLKELFGELAFSQEITTGAGSSGRSLKFSRSKIDEEALIGNRMDLVLLLYPFFASLLGIEKLRQCCATWLLLEQYLQRFHNWKWEYTGDTSKNAAESINAQRPIFSKIPTSEYNPARLLLNGVGWSIPQSQGARGGKSSMNYKPPDDPQRTPLIKHVATLGPGKREPWFWFPSPAASWDGPDFLSRIGGLKDELPWKIRSSIICSVRAHPGALRTLAVCHDECTVFTGGVGPGFKGTVQKWELPRMDCVSGYYGHEEKEVDGLAYAFGFRVGSLPSMYPGLPLCIGKPALHLWDKVLESKKRKLSHGKVTFFV
ncbi:protein GFS12 isoform X3 [Magnolia sinica]|uniref:protein GFS12 isoform X3 n=1 Tax=Magnolia sinica TaxID=86752 RepID=UPI00265A3420|nr:protein GFS12 isoform X3 [Magnolia sinica]